MTNSPKKSPLKQAEVALMNSVETLVGSSSSSTLPQTKIPLKVAVASPNQSASVKAKSPGTPGCPNSECVICLEDLSKAPYVGTLPPCKHTFCFSCISSWSQQETTCPLCKKEFKSISKKMGKNAAAELVTSDTPNDPEKNGSSKSRKRKAANDAERSTTVKVQKKTQAEYYDQRQADMMNQADAMRFMMHLGMGYLQRHPMSDNLERHPIMDMMMMMMMMASDEDEDDVIMPGMRGAELLFSSPAFLSGLRQGSSSPTSSRSGSPRSPRNSSRGNSRNASSSSSSSSSSRSRSGSSRTRTVVMNLSTSSQRNLDTSLELDSESASASVRPTGSATGSTTSSAAAGTTLNPINLTDVDDEEPGASSSSSPQPPTTATRAASSSSSSSSSYSSSSSSSSK